MGVQVYRNEDSGEEESVGVLGLYHPTAVPTNAYDEGYIVLDGPHLRVVPHNAIQRSVERKKLDTG